MEKREIYLQAAQKTPAGR